MSISIISRFLQFVLAGFMLLYFWTEFEFQKELIITIVTIASCLVIADAIRFGLKEKSSIELGVKFESLRTKLFKMLIPFLIILFVVIIWKTRDYNWFPDSIERKDTSAFFPLIFGLPSFINGIVGMIYGRSKETYYASHKGLILSTRGDEVKKWNDFYNYTLVENQNTIQFQKKNLKYIIIQYESDYFHKYQEEITFFLDQKLTRI